MVDRTANKSAGHLMTNIEGGMQKRTLHCVFKEVLNKRELAMACSHTVIGKLAELLVLRNAGAKSRAVGCPIDGTLDWLRIDSLWRADDLVAIDSTVIQVERNTTSNHELINSRLNQSMGLSESFAKLRDRLRTGIEPSEDDFIDRVKAHSAAPAVSPKVRVRLRGTAILFITSFPQGYEQIRIRRSESML
jgi:hypothetical protein